MKRITINVTKDDILQGERGNELRCPIARACQRAGFISPAVDTDCVEYDLTHILGRSKLPKEASLFVANFDDRHDVEPFTFEIDVEDFEDANQRHAERCDNDWGD